MSFLGFNLTKEDIESFEGLYKKLHQKQQSHLEDVCMSLDDWFTPSEDYYEFRMQDGSWIRMGKSFYDKLLVHPEVTRQSEITHAWIDDAKQLEDSKKKHKAKQQIPYWANNWRKK